MNSEIEIKYRTNIISESELNQTIEKSKSSYDILKSSNMEMTGWLDYPEQMTKGMLDEINKMASHIRNQFTALVVVGIGGSFLGAKAAIDYLVNSGDELKTKIYFAGINLSTSYHGEILKKIENENVAVCIISKSGGTTETLVTGHIFTDYIEKKYGAKEKKNRIFAITDPQNGRLRQLVNDEGYSSLPIPADIGGRYSVLSAVGLLPMAVAGIDIKNIIDGALSACGKSLTEKAIKLSAVRNLLEEKGYTVELIASFEPYITNFIQWIKQLYGESEGKAGKGLLPVDLEYTKDLHSLGQFIQDGRQIFLETLLSVNDTESDIKIPSTWGVYEHDMTLSQLNDAALNGVINAHSKAGIPLLEIVIPGRTEYAFGQAAYFFQTSCAIRGIMMDINPFNQPGVEKYKEEMRKSLKTP